MRVKLHFLISALLLLAVAPGIGDQELPRLGDDARLKLQQEYELGQGLYSRLKDAGFIVSDPLVSRYISDIGEALLSSLDVRKRDYQFFLVRDPSVNAFAAPGGFIGINIGLIAMSRREDELASVLAHEIAHVELAHTMQMIERSQALNTAGMLSILAAILIGSQDPDAATAMIYTGAAGSTQAMVNFTRANEYEADRVGIELLKKSDYDPKAMADFMGLLQQREQSGELAGIEYIRTHPISSNRVAEIQARVAESKEKKPVLTRFSQFQDYLLHLYPTLGFKPRTTPFALALAAMRAGRHAEADEKLRELKRQDVDSIWYQYAFAENLEFQGKFQAAAEIYRNLLLLYPDDIAISLRQIAVLTELQQLPEALGLVERLLELDEQQVAVYQAQVKLYQLLGDELSRQYAEANFHWFEGNQEQAKKLFRALLALPDLDPGRAQKINEKLLQE